jgi:tetratricopeptide (TPR) repeat protein
MSDPTDVFELRDLAKKAKALGEMDKALSIYEELLSLRPSWSVFYWEIGSLLMDVGNYPRAITIFKKAVRLDPKDAIAWGLLGISLIHVSDYQGAEKALRACIKLKPLSYYHVCLACSLRMQGKLNEALRYCKKAIKLNKTDPEAYYNYGLIMVDLGLTQEARKAFSKAILLEPGYELAIQSLRQLENFELRDLAMKAKALGEMDKALSIYEELLSLRPSLPVFYWEFGCLLMDIGNLPRAITLFKKAIRIDRTDATAWRRLGLCLLQVSNYQGAEKALRVGARLKPTSYNYVLLACSLHEQGKLNEALRYCKKAIKLNKTDPDAYYNYGLIMVDLGLTQEARKAFSKALLLEPGHEYAIQSLRELKDSDADSMN